MAVRWTITFKTLSNKTGVVKIYDSTYTGTPIVLTPASSPIKISRKQTELISPVMTETGYIQIIDIGDYNLHIEEIHPSGSFERKVEFYVDSELTWMGYISPETFSIPWEPTPRIVQFSLVGGLQVLDSVNIQPTSDGLETIASFIKMCIDATGLSISGVVFARQMVRISLQTSVPEFALQLSRYNFLNLTDRENMNDADWTEFVGDSLLTVLTEICRYFGWTASIECDMLMLSTPRVDIINYRYLPMSLLNSFVAGTTLSPVTTDYSRSYKTPVFDGINHRKSITNGKNRITITTDLNNSGGNLPELFFDGAVKYNGQYSFESGLEDLTALNKVLDPTKEHVVLHKYDITGTESNPTQTEITWSYPTSMDMRTPAAYLIKALTYKTNESPIQKSLVNAIKICGDWVTNDLQVRHNPFDSKLISISSRKPAIFPAGTALSINADLQISYVYPADAGYYKDQTGSTMWGAYNRDLRVSLRVGSKWFNGSTWGDSEVIFNISCWKTGGSLQEMYNNNVGTITDNIGITMPYNGASGFLIPIDQMLNGVVELSFYNWTYLLPLNNVTFRVSPTSIYISNLRINYLDDTGKNSRAVYLSRLTNKNFESNLNIQLRISSCQDSRIGYAQLWYNDTQIGRFEVLYYPNSVYLAQPEEWLMDTLIKCYSNPCEQLVLETAYDSTLEVHDFIVIGNNIYIIMGIETDYADEHTRLTIARYQ